MRSFAHNSIQLVSECALRPLPSNVVHVWHVNLRPRSPQSGTQLYKLLSPDEKKRAANYRSEREHRHFCQARAALRITLAHYLNIPPAEVCFKFAPYGKPMLAEPSQRWLQFNLSHSRDSVLIAIARDRLVGIDIEYLRPDLDVAHLAPYLFSPIERVQWQRAAAAEQQRLFYQHWVCKQAYLKAIGGGLHSDPRFVLLSLPSRRAPQVEFRDICWQPFDSLRAPDRADGRNGSDWTMLLLPDDPDYIAAVAAAGAAISIEERPFELLLRSGWDRFSEPSNFDRGQRHVGFFTQR
ncbi:MAG: 4'-phosphopantetheinyl transferase superfamily protein [Verrucomicrobiota bacterium]|nr:4'-phosphopantetheinyl transferase superfamily protein [Verrucomicrobiota bacterium]